jgi:hypothetical protein
VPGWFEITRAIIIQVWTFVNSKLQVQAFEWIADECCVLGRRRFGKEPVRGPLPTQSSGRGVRVRTDEEGA